MSSSFANTQPFQAHQQLPDHDSPEYLRMQIVIRDRVIRRQAVLLEQQSIVITEQEEKIRDFLNGYRYRKVVIP